MTLDTIFIESRSFKIIEAQEVMWPEIKAKRVREARMLAWMRDDLCLRAIQKAWGDRRTEVQKFWDETILKALSQ